VNSLIKPVILDQRRQRFQEAAVSESWSLVYDWVKEADGSDFGRKSAKTPRRKEENRRIRLSMKRAGASKKDEPDLRHR